MATRTIANAGGNWSSTATWVEGAVPTSADDVVATATSGNLTIDSGAGRLCRSIDLSGYTGAHTLTHQAGVNLNIGDATAGAGNVALKFTTWEAEGHGGIEYEVAIIAGLKRIVKSP